MKKTLLIGGVFLVVIAAGAFLYLKFRKLDDFEPLLRKKLQEVVQKGSGGLYHIQIEKINADVVKSRLILSRVHLSYDSVVYARMLQAGNAPADVFDIQMTSIAVDGIKPEDLVRKKDIRLNIVLAENPEVNVYHHKNAGKAKKTDTLSIYQRIKKEIGSFGLNKLSLKDIDFTYHNRGAKVQSSFKDLNIDLDSILIDEETQYDTSRFLYSKDALISLKDFRHKTADSLYIFKLDRIAVHAAKNRVTIKKLQLEPRGSKQWFRKMLKVRKDRYDITVNNIVFNDIDWWRFVTDEGIYIGEGTISDGKLEIYSDKKIPPGNKPKLGTYPHQQLFKSDLPLYIRKIKCRNLDVTYSEIGLKTGKEGHLSFQNTSATIANVTNIADSIRRNAHFTIDAVSRFMNEGKLKAGFNFNLARQKEGIFSVYADMGRMDATALNKATVPLASVEIKKATIERLKVNIDGNNYNARGRIFVTYRDLNINALKLDDDGKMKKRGLVSFIANNFKINKDYPKKGKEPETFKTYRQRPIKKSFFSLIWKTIFDGVKEAVGI